jgi:hypothetical protein
MEKVDRREGRRGEQLISRFDLSPALLMRFEVDGFDTRAYQTDRHGRGNLTSGRMTVGYRQLLI